MPQTDGRTDDGKIFTVSPLVILTIETTMVSKVINELKFISRLKIFQKQPRDIIPLCARFRFFPSVASLLKRSFAHTVVSLVRVVS